MNNDVQVLPYLAYRSHGIVFYSLTACPNYDRVQLNCFDSIFFCCRKLERYCWIIKLTFSGFFNVFEDWLIDRCVIISVDRFIVVDVGVVVAFIVVSIAIAVPVVVTAAALALLHKVFT